MSKYCCSFFVFVTLSLSRGRFSNIPTCRTTFQNKIFETIWNPIEENAKDLVKQNSLVSDYIRDYLTLRNKKIPNKNKVYAEFKGLYSNKKDEDYLQELEKIKSLSAAVATAASYSWVLQKYSFRTCN